MKHIFQKIVYLFGGSRIKKPAKYDGQKWDLSLGCPDCGGTSLYEGPQGGMCTNICCANPFCRSAFNDMGIAFMVERIPNTYFRSAFPECPEESEAYLRTQIKQDLDKESEEMFNALDGRTYG